MKAVEAQLLGVLKKASQFVIPVINGLTVGLSGSVVSYGMIFYGPAAMIVFRFISSVPSFMWKKGCTASHTRHPCW